MDNSFSNGRFNAEGLATWLKSCSLFLTKGWLYFGTAQAVDLPLRNPLAFISPG
jgi:hypothetical protein